MKHIYIVLLSMPIYAYAQVIAPRRPLAIDSINTQSPFKYLLQLREKKKQKQYNHPREPHEVPYTIQQIKDRRPHIKSY